MLVIAVDKTQAFGQPISRDVPKKESDSLRLWEKDMLLHCT